MASDGKHKHKHLRPHSQFAVGSDIEVTSDEEGFRGIWFPAKILSLPSKTRRNQYLVEYKSLLSEDNSSNLLTEYADRSFIRPALTPEKGDESCFEVNAVVEAFHHDGWWVGAVVSVLGDGKYRVRFHSPADELDFERSCLRIHKDWVDGKWILPQKKEKDLSHTNFIALIDGIWVFSLQDPSLNIDANSLPPGNSGDKNESVEDLKSGQDEKIVPSERDNVDNRSTPSRIEQATDVHLPQDSKIKTPMPEGLKDQLPANLDIHASDNMQDHASNGNSPSSWTKMAAEGKNYVYSTNKKASSKSRRRKNLVDAQDPEIRTPRKPTDVETGKDTMEKENATEREEVEFIDEGTPHGSLKTQDKSNVDDTNELTGGNETLRKSRRQKTSVYESCILALKPGRKKRRTMIEPLSSSQESEAGPNCADETEANLKCVVEPEPDSNGGGGDINVKDKPLPRLLPDPCSPPMLVDSTTIAEKGLPFSKTSPIWKAVEELEVFKQIPQNPHFTPLYFDVKQDCREGFAIGCMVTFSNLVQKISRLGVGDHKNLLDDSLDALRELESHGFDVEPIRARLTELISIKTSYEWSRMESESIKREIVERQKEKANADEEIKQIDKMMAELMVKRDYAVLRMEEKEAEIEELESKMESVEGGFEAVQEFERLVKKPW